MTLPEDTGPCPRGCGARVRWVLSWAQFRICLDHNPTPAGTIVLEPDDRDRPRGRYLTGTELPAQQTAYTLHTCPRPDTGPPCAACTLPMHPVLSRTLNWITHPACDPTNRPRPTPRTYRNTHHQHAHQNHTRQGTP